MDEQLLDAYSAAIAEKFFIEDMLKKWEKYKHSKARQSKWKTKNNQIISVCNLTNTHIYNILHCNFSISLPNNWRKLLESELQFRSIDFEYWYNEVSKYEEVIKAGNIVL